MEKITKEKIIEEVKNIPQRAKKGKWVLTLDTDEGSFFYSPKVIPDGSELYSVNDEFSVYFDKNFESQGVMVECYNSNFIKHHSEFEDMTKDIFKGEKEDIKVVDPEKEKSKEVNEFKVLFERTLIAEACGAKLHE